MIIDGKKIAAEIVEKLRPRLAALPQQPLLCDVVVGDDPVSLSYVNVKRQAAEKIGMLFDMVQLPETSGTEDVVQAIAEANRNPKLCGLIVQLPLPLHIDRQAVLQAIPQEIDVDGINPDSANAFYDNQSMMVPPTAAAIMEILNHVPVEYLAKQILVIGQGELVGRPITHLLQQKNINVITADAETQNLADLIRGADVIIAATGQARLIHGDMIKPGAVVIDAGTSESGAGIVGDVDFESVKDVASFVSPVPGGVGPVTVAKLLENVVTVAENRHV